MFFVLALAQVAELIPVLAVVVESRWRSEATAKSADVLARTGCWFEG